MVNLTYHLAKSIEFISCRIGTGRFEVNPHHLCAACADREGSDLCTDCQDSWLEELTVLDYSDAFERRLNASLGIACLVLGTVAAIANKGEKWWVEGGLVAWLTYPLTLLPTLTPTARIFYQYFLTLLILLSLFVLAADMLVACFLMAMNPIGERHWRNVNWGVYVVLALQAVLFVGVYILGNVKSFEFVFVIAPVMMGLAALGVAACVGLERRAGGEEHDGVLRLGDEETLVGERK